MYHIILLLAICVMWQLLVRLLFQQIYAFPPDNAGVTQLVGDNNVTALKICSELILPLICFPKELFYQYMHRFAETKK